MLGKMGMTLLLRIFFFLTVLDKAVGPKKWKKMLILNLLLTEKQAVGLAS